MSRFIRLVVNPAIEAFQRRCASVKRILRFSFLLARLADGIEAEVVAENGIEVDVSVGVGLDVPEEDFPNFQLLALFVVEAILLCVAALKGEIA